MSTGLEHSQTFSGYPSHPRDPFIAPALVVIPLLTHERDTGGRISDNGIDGISLQRREHAQTIAVYQLDLTHRATAP
jgi:hypothetical protein